MNASELLKSYEIPLTKQRIEILNRLITAKSPLTIEDFKKDLPDINESTIYRNLGKLSENNLITKLNLNSNFAHYEINTINYTKTGHYHIVCTICKSVSCIDLKGLDKIFNNKLKNLDYSSVSHNLEFSGVCPKCRKNKAL